MYWGVGRLGVLSWISAVGEMFSGSMFCIGLTRSTSSFFCGDFGFCAEAFLPEFFPRATFGLSFLPFFEAEPCVLWFGAELTVFLALLAVLVVPLVLGLVGGFLVCGFEARREDERVTGGVRLWVLVTGCFDDFGGFALWGCFGGRVTLEVEGSVAFDGCVTDFGFCTSKGLGSLLLHVSESPTLEREICG